MIDVLLLFYEPSPGGQSNHVLALANGLDKTRFRVAVAYPQHHTSTGKALKDVDVTAMALPVRRLNNALAGIKLLRLLRKDPVDILHVHGHEAGIWGRVVGRLAGVRANIYTPHTLHSGVLGERTYLRMEGAMARSTDFWVSVNNSDCATLTNCGIPAAKISVVPNGIDAGAVANRARGASRDALGIREDEPLVVQVGRISTQKGPGYFMRAAAKALERNQSIRFLLVGDGPLRAEMELLAKSLGVARNVLFLGWRDDVVQVMSCADVVALSSLWEGLPYVLLEAMALGKPVVATDVGGNPEIVENERTGFIVPPRDEMSLAQGVLRLTEDPTAARRMGEAGRQRASEHFSLSKMMKLTEEVYSKALA
ncbi:MAG: glycosyltransferase family 4 protein [Chloroflexi bacterium]|nr:glycosyltransferase family 4 protein [Chloroflexota bacterium]